MLSGFYVHGNQDLCGVDLNPFYLELHRCCLVDREASFLECVDERAEWWWLMHKEVKKRNLENALVVTHSGYVHWFICINSSTVPSPLSLTWYIFS